jgi:GNAT superfamily N-acetyltransferase
MRAEIRRATAADARALAELRYAFRSAIAAPQEARDDFVARCERWMADRLHRNAGWWAWLADGAEGPLGTVWLHRVEKLPNPVAEREAHGYITSFFVKPEARSAGIGTALLRAALAECESRGFDSVILWPTPRSRALYERHGFAAREDVFVRVLRSG